MRIRVISAHGDGQVKSVEVAEATTIAELLASQFPDEDFSVHLVRVNRDSAAPEQILRDGDRVTVTPLSIEGACAKRSR